MENLDPSFEPLHCQMDYGDNSVVVQWEGKFNETVCLHYLLSCYPGFRGREIISHSEPNEYKGFKNCGSTTFK